MWKFISMFMFLFVYVSALLGGPCESISDCIETGIPNKVYLIGAFIACPLVSYRLSTIYRSDPGVRTLLLSLFGIISAFAQIGVGFFSIRTEHGAHMAFAWIFFICGGLFMFTSPWVIGYFAVLLSTFWVDIDEWILVCMVLIYFGGLKVKQPEKKENVLLSTV